MMNDEDFDGLLGNINKDDDKFAKTPLERMSADIQTGAHVLNMFRKNLGDVSPDVFASQLILACRSGAMTHFWGAEDLLEAMNEAIGADEEIERIWGGAWDPVEDIEVKEYWTGEKDGKSLATHASDESKWWHQAFEDAVEMLDDREEF